MKIYSKKILVVDAELSTRQILETRLSVLGYKVFLASDRNTAFKLFKKEQPNLIVLDIMLPQKEGFDICAQIRKESKVPIIMSAPLSDVSDRIMGLELGADDFMVKPFLPKELEARIYSLFRRLALDSSSNFRTLDPTVFQVGKLVIDLSKRQVFKDKNRIKLTSIEFNLLELLITKAGEVLSRPVILNLVWGYIPERHLDTRVVDVHISRLRAKLEEDPSNPGLIITARGTGYMFQKY